MILLKLILMSLFITSVVLLGIYCGWIIGVSISRGILDKN